MGPTQIKTISCVLPSPSFAISANSWEGKHKSLAALWDNDRSHCTVLGQIYPRMRFLQCKHFVYLSDASCLGTNCDKHKESCTLLPSQQRPFLGLGLLSRERSKMENHKKVNCLCPDRQLLLKAYGPACRTNLGCPQVLHHHDTPTQRS